MNDEIAIFRSQLVKKLTAFKDEHIIKILCGVRRCGKSTILKTYKSELLSLGVKESNIIQRLYTAMEYQDSFDGHAMYADLSCAVKNAATVQTGIHCLHRKVCGQGNRFYGDSAGRENVRSGMPDPAGKFRPGIGKLKGHP